jgi:hypothetical protein
MYLKDLAQERDLAERVWKFAWRRHPGDYWINLQLAILPAPDGPAPPEQLRRWQEDRLRFATAAVAVRPRSAFAFALVGEALANRQRTGEAIDACARRSGSIPGSFGSSRSS